MGEEIQRSDFSAADYERFKQRLAEETALLKQWFESGRFVEEQPVAGFELEAWLVDEQYRPAPRNEEFLKRLDDPLASPELASFNFEVNSTPRRLQGHVFSALQAELHATWRHCAEVAAGLDCRTVMIGILPTLQNEDLQLGNMSKMERYRALNREVLRLRRGRPLVLDVNGEEHLRVTHRDVMLESAATSFQVHMQITQQSALRIYNASIILSAPMVAVAANSPFLFGKDLWDETRIPVFEQAVAIGGYEGAVFGPIRRVTLGTGYVRESLFELFEENLQHYPVLLPVDYGEAGPDLHHLRLHNGTIWRWNRPLIGFDAKGRPHLRLEHRVMPAGPSLIDILANAAFYYGTVTALASADTPPESRLDFVTARDNFYEAARLGLRGHMVWLDGSHRPMPVILAEELLPLAEQGLQQLGVAQDEIETYLGIIAARVHSGQNGAAWQRAFVERHGRDMLRLTAAYLKHQESQQAVHEWTV